MTVAFVLAYALQIVLRLAPIIDPGDRKARNDPLAASLTGIALGAGALLFGGTLAAHGDSAWPGVLGGLLVVALAQRASWPVIVRARTRLDDRAAREALTLYLDAARPGARRARRAPASARLRARRTARLVCLARPRARG